MLVRGCLGLKVCSAEMLWVLQRKVGEEVVRTKWTDEHWLCFVLAAVPGYQHSRESVNAHTPQFFIYKIDASNREQRLEDKGA